MKRILQALILLTVATTACSSSTNEAPTDSGAPPVDTATPTPHLGPPSTSSPTETTPTPLRTAGTLQLNLATKPTPTPNKTAAAEPGEPIDYTEQFHDHSDHTITGPLPWPDTPPANAPPLLVAEFVTAVITNTSPDQPMDPNVIAPWLVPDLAAEFRLATTGANTTASTAAVLVQSSLVDETQTAHRAQVHLLFEQHTAGVSAFVHVEALLVLDTESRWVIAHLTIRNQ